MTIPDISRKSYDNRTFPILYAQKDITVKNVLYLKNEEFLTYHYNYDRIVNLLKENKLNVNKVHQIQNAPCIK